MVRSPALAVLATVGLFAAAGAEAAPIATIQASIGSTARTIEFLLGGGIGFCDGSVRTCDGSVRPIEGARWTANNNGSFRLATPLVMLGDGSVRVGDGSVVPPPELDRLLLPAVSFSPFPEISATVGVLDSGDPTTFIITFGTVMSLTGPGYTYSLSGGGTLTDVLGNGVSLTQQSFQGGDGVFFGLVDNALVAATGTTASFPPPATGGVPPFAYPYTAASVAGAGSCAACDLLSLAFAVAGSGNGDKADLFATFDVNPIGVAAPAPLGLLAMGLLGLAAVSRRR
jgi:hypothetical protein